MYKMKEVCQMTGLTEKAIRIYMDQKLINPKVEEGIHRKAYFFSDQDIERLKDIATLRNTGFSIAEIKQMQENPEMLSLLIEERKELLESEIIQKQTIYDSLKRLTIEEHSDVAKLADAIEPRSIYAKETPKKKHSRKVKWLILILIAIILFGWNGLVNGKVVQWMFLTSFGFVFGIISLLFGIRYLFYNAKTRKMSSRGLGKITAIVENENIEAYIGAKERGAWKEILAYLTFGLFGEGIWNMLRPDAWYPVISYQTEGGTVHMATTRYGAFRNTWNIGDTLPITWEDKKERLVHICGKNVFRKKASMYILIGIVLLTLFSVGTVKLRSPQGNSDFSIPDSQRLEYPVQADRVEMEIEQKRYVLNEDEINVIKTLLENAEIRAVEKYRYLDREGLVNIYFYQGGQQIEMLSSNEFFYVYASNGMKYWMEPVPMEFRGMNLVDSGWVTLYLRYLEAKVLERYAVEEIIGIVSEREELEDLKEILQVTEYFKGAYVIRDGYQFIFTEQGFADYFGREPKENEVGKIEVILQDGEFVNAVLMSYCHDELGDVEEETYRKDW